MTKFEEFVQALPSEEGVLITSPVNRRYVTDFASSDGIVFAAGGKILLFLDMRYLEMAKIAQRKGRISENIEIREYSRHKEYIENQLSSGVRRILFEDHRTTCAQLEALQKRYPSADFQPLGERVESMRSVKTPRELERIKSAQALTGAAFRHILGFIREGVTEREIALELDFFMKKQGAEDSAFETICVSGSKSSLPHGRPENVPITRNSFITMDYGAKLDGYCSDMTRTVVFGRADERQRLIYDTVLRAQEAAIAAAKGGVIGSAVDKAAREVIEKAGFGPYFTHSTGHSVGLEIHESPNFSPRSEGIIPAGAVVSVEPGIYLEGEYGVRIEDMVYLTESGCEDLTPVEKNLLELG